MGEHLFKNWPAYVLMIGFAVLVIAMIRSSGASDKKGQEQSKPQEKK